MGLLALGGAISGMGQGLQQGLHTLQAGIQQAGLSAEDRAFQLEKLKAQQEFEGQREQRGYEHTEKMADQNQKFQTELHEGDRAAASAEKEIDRTQGSIEKDKDRGLEGRKLDIAADAQKSLDEYHKKIGSYYENAKGKGTGKATSDLPDSKKELAHQHGKEAEHFFKLAEGAMDDKQKKNYIDMGKAALAKGYAILGEAPDAKDPDPGAVDPFGKSPLDAKPGAAEAAPKSPGILGKVPSEPAPPPKDYGQRAEEQLKDSRFDQLRRFLDKPAGPPVPPGPGVNLPPAQ